MQLVHLVTYNDKFIPAQLRFLNQEFDKDLQKFYLLGGGSQINSVLGGNVVRLDRRTLWRFLADAYRCDRLVLNGLYSHLVIVMLLGLPLLLHKAVWLPWGGDLYWRDLVPSTRWNTFIDYLRGLFFRRVGAIATPTYGDYLKAVDLYQTSARYINGCPNIFAFEAADLDVLSRDAADFKRFRPTRIIQVGNSADPSNEHLEVFEWLQRFAGEDVEIHVPLSYGFQGVESYRESVLRRGAELFGVKFKPMLSLLDVKEYNQYLAQVDVMVFNHRRQQGFGNMAISLYMGTKVYLRSHVSTWNFLVDEMGCTLFDSREIEDASFGRFVEFSSDIRHRNKRAVAHLFERTWQKEMWRELYRG